MKSWLGSFFILRGFQLAEIAIFGSKADKCCCVVAEEIRGRGQDVYFLDVHDLPELLEDPDFLTDLLGDFSRYKAIYNRFWLNKLCDQSVQDAFEQIQIAIQSSSALVLNRPTSGLFTASKLVGMQVLGDYGFQIPDYFCTSNPDVAHSRLCIEEQLITKGCSSIRTHAEIYQPGDDFHLPKLRSSPVIFQKRIVGPEYRVHVIGNDTCVVKIECDFVDYRRRAGDGEPKISIAKNEIPEKLLAKCIEFCSKNDLCLAGFDFIHDRETNEFLLLEVNVSPGFVYFDIAANGAMVALIVDLLVAGQCEYDPLLSIGSLEVNDGVFIEAARRPSVTY